MTELVSILGSSQLVTSSLVIRELAIGIALIVLGLVAYTWRTQKNPDD